MYLLASSVHLRTASQKKQLLWEKKNSNNSCKHKNLYVFLQNNSNKKYHGNTYNFNYLYLWNAPNNIVFQALGDD